MMETSYPNWVRNAHDRMVLDRAIEASIGLQDTVIYVNLCNDIFTLTYHRTEHTVLEFCNGKAIAGAYYDNHE